MKTIIILSFYMVLNFINSFGDNEVYLLDDYNHIINV